MKREHVKSCVWFHYKLMTSFLGIFEIFVFVIFFVTYFIRVEDFNNDTDIVTMRLYVFSLGLEHSHLGHVKSLIKLCFQHLSTKSFHVSVTLSFIFFSWLILFLLFLVVSFLFWVIHSYSIICVIQDNSQTHTT